MPALDSSLYLLMTPPPECTDSPQPDSPCLTPCGSQTIFIADRERLWCVSRGRGHSHVSLGHNGLKQTHNRCWLKVHTTIYPICGNTDCKMVADSRLHEEWHKTEVACNQYGANKDTRMFKRDRRHIELLEVVTRLSIDTKVLCAVDVMLIAEDTVKRQHCQRYSVNRPENTVHNKC